MLDKTTTEFLTRLNIMKSITNKYITASLFKKKKGYHY